MKVSYFSYGADSGGEYEVIDKGVPRTLLGKLLPIPATQNDGQISLQEAAGMALAHNFDDGCFEVIEGPSKPITVRASEQYVVNFKGDTGWEIELKNTESLLEKRKAQLVEIISRNEKSQLILLKRIEKARIKAEKARGYTGTLARDAIASYNNLTKNLEGPKGFLKGLKEDLSEVETELKKH